MNHWTKRSIEFANQRNYLDELFKVYSISPNATRDIPAEIYGNIGDAFVAKNNQELIETLLQLDLFPIKDSYVAYLKHDRSAIKRNPQTINRIAGNLYSMGLDKVYEKCMAPKETNRQIGPLFKYWLDTGSLGVPIYRTCREFMKTTDNAILNVSDAEMKNFATATLGYNHDKGLDFIGRFNNIYVVGEAKFLTDFGGHQNAQFNDAIATITSHFSTNKLGSKVKAIAILDGVLYIKGGNKMYRHLENHDDQIIISSLLLREYLYSI